MKPDGLLIDFDMSANSFLSLCQSVQERRMKQQREVLKKEKETTEKIGARAFAQSYLADLVPSVFGTLSDNGYFYDPVERDVETGFLPWLMEEVEKCIGKSVLGRTMMDGELRTCPGLVQAVCNS